jgi:hypothetical protein
VAVLLGHVHVVSDDQAEYLALRDAWLATGRFVNPATGLATAYRDPGYPLFLVLLARVAGVGHFAIWVAQSMIGALAGACLVATSTRAGGASAGRVTAVLFLLDLVFASYSFMVYPEVLAVGLICLALWAWPEASPHPARLRTTVTSVILSAAVLVRAAIAPLLLGIGIAGAHNGHLSRRWRRRHHSELQCTSTGPATRSRSRQRCGLRRLGISRRQPAFLRLGDGLPILRQCVDAEVRFQCGSQQARAALCRRGRYLDERQCTRRGLQQQPVCGNRKWPF